jgi:hypothetical protein
MREAQDKVAKLCDIDEQTFVRFGEFAYTGNYASARDTARHTEGNPNHGGPDLGLPPPGAVSKKRGGYTQKACNYCGHGSEEQPRKRILWAEFRQRYQSGSMVCCETRKNMEEGEDYTDVFLCHARVYAFAEKYDILALRDLALQKLQRTLDAFNVCGKRVKDIVCLARYAYSNDNTCDSETGQDNIDKLRRLVVHYIVCVYRTVAENTSFLQLMEEGGPFASDLTRMVARRVALSKPDERSV